MTEPTPEDVLVPEPVEPEDGQDQEWHIAEHVVQPFLSTTQYGPRDADDVARIAAADNYNTPGYCLQVCRTWAGIPSQHRTAAIAWQYAVNKQYNRNVPRGAFAFWTGGSSGYGHIAVGLGGGLIRSTDAGGAGIVATRTLDWFGDHWPSMHYAGWADNVNGYTVPGVKGDWFDMASEDELRAVVRQAIMGDEFLDAVAQRVQAAVWDRQMSVENLKKETVKKEVSKLVREVWEETRQLQPSAQKG